MRPPIANGSASAIQATKIKLQIGERIFVTTLETLVRESTYFAALLTGRWETIAQPIFVDADAELFEYVLRYLRRGLFPLFYTTGIGHDHAQYYALLGEAKFFGIQKLVMWLQHRRYFQAITTTMDFEIFKTTQAVLDSGSGVDSHTTTQLFPWWSNQKVYVCPRGISLHRGAPTRCGRMCLRSQRNDANVYEDEAVLKMLKVMTKTDINYYVMESGLYT
ncbi:hypothetical protein CDD81_6329 [Ophiocordyceps australis]|uniref:BTB domain-containing protein n=1 Tax=Ophiocordyceps australis TaxID=1399860 RepID=A0A2C5Y800_9HYPO|nr:hypothetical protein CDD81_6329 [Ophiocordyceps australis]